ncbi:hypothetical protein RN001_000894 [Aquatica leii]|uniref:Regulatory protein zeste n=1 Tax=Aquatica leii TaxID=1421715 RepID=A0AAN7SQP8_9COLE|nr:hypothetical protein RN001_000894 [Aquatica leii]
MAEGDAKMRQLSAKQKETLVNFVYARPEMQKGKLTPTYTKVVANTLWEEVTSILNSIPGGAIKTSTQWNKTWRDLMKNVKNKVSKEKKFRNGTGGGPPMPPPTTESDKTIDEKIFEILTPVAVEGNLDVPDPFVISEDITWDINKETTKDMNDNEDMDIDHDYAVKNTSGIPIKKINLQPQCDDLHTASEVKATVLKTNKENIEHNTTKKRYTKSLRLSDSVKNNEKFLMISKQGISSTQDYRQRKLQILQNHYDKKHEYYQEKLKIFKEISGILTEILQ